MAVLRCSKRKKSLVANVFTGPIMEKNHSSARNATKTSVAETRPLTKVFYDLDTKVESATGRGIEGKTDVCI